MRRWTKRLIACAALLLFAVPAWALSPFILLFDSGSARLDRAAEAIVDRTVAVMRALDVREIEITGGADRVGAGEANLALSRRRAEAVRDALLARGMSHHVRVRIVAAGERLTLVDTEDGVAEVYNRYGQIVFYETCIDYENGRRSTEGECATPLPA